MKNAGTFFCAIVIASLLTACSSEPKPTTDNSAASKTAEEKKPEATFVTGREGLQKMYVAARSFAPDVKPFNLVSLASKENPGKDGKSGIWFAGFAAPSKQKSKVYTWAGVQVDGGPDLGVSFKPDDTWSPSNTSTQPFDLGFVKTDSDNAFKEAQEHGGDKLMKKSPETLVFYRLDWNPRENQAVWHVMYGPDRDNPKLRIAVDATSGKFIKVER